MQIKQLEYFICLVAEKNYTHAAEKLFLSRQGLRRCIAKLEAELNVPLVFYDRGHIKLTKQGKLFYDYSVDAVYRYKNLISELDVVTRKEDGEVSFVVPHGFFETVSMDMVFNFANLHHDLQYVYQVSTDLELEQAFMNGNFDFAFSTNPMQREEFDYYPLFRNFRCIAVSKQHPLYSRQTISATDLKNVKIAVFNTLFFDYPFIMQYCRNAGFEPDLFLHYDTSAMEQFARSGQGVELTIASISAHTNDSSGELKKIFFTERDIALSSYPVNIITLRGKPVKPIVAEMIQFIQDCCSRLVQEQNYYPFNLSLQPL